MKMAGDSEIEGQAEGSGEKEAGRPCGPLVPARKSSIRHFLELRRRLLPSRRSIVRPQGAEYTRCGTQFQEFLARL